MHNNLNTPSTAQPTALARLTAAESLEQSRLRVRAVLRDIQIAEGRFLDFATAEDISRTLSTVMRDLEAVQLSVAVMQRRKAVN